MNPLLSCFILIGHSYLHECAVLQGTCHSFHYDFGVGVVHITYLWCTSTIQGVWFTLPKCSLKCRRVVIKRLICLLNEGCGGHEWKSSSKTMHSSICVRIVFGNIGYLISLINFEVHNISIEWFFHDYAGNKPSSLNCNFWFGSQN